MLQLLLDLLSFGKFLTPASLKALNTTIYVLSWNENFMTLAKFSGWLVIASLFHRSKNSDRCRQLGRRESNFCVRVQAAICFEMLQIFLFTCPTSIPGNFSFLHFLEFQTNCFSFFTIFVSMTFEKFTLFE